MGRRPAWAPQAPRTLQQTVAISLACLAAVASGCGERSESTPAPFVRAPHNEAGPDSAGDGGWRGDRGIVLGYREGRRFALVFALHNRSRSTVHLLGAGGRQPGHRLLRRVGVQIRLAPRPLGGDLVVTGLGPWSRDAPRPVAVPPGRDVFVQLDFVMRDCRFFDPGARETYNRATLVRYRDDAETRSMPVDLAGDQITVTAPALSGCPGATRTASTRAFDELYAYGRLRTAWPCSTLRAAIGRLPSGGGPTFSTIPQELERAAAEACASGRARRTTTTGRLARA